MCEKKFSSKPGLTYHLKAHNENDNENENEMENNNDNKNNDQGFVVI